MCFEYEYSATVNNNLNIRFADFEWPSLNFGWTLADVVKRTRELKELKAQKDSSRLPLNLVEIIEETEEKGINEELAKVPETKINENFSDASKDANVFELSSECEPLMEIGTWSNDMANDIQTFSFDSQTNFVESGEVVREYVNDNCLLTKESIILVFK